MATGVHEREQRRMDLEPAVTADRNTELRAAQHDRIAKLPAGVLDVLDHERQARREQKLADGGDQLWVLRAVATPRGGSAPRLTGRTCMDGVELRPEGRILKGSHSVSPDELERVARLGRDVDAHHVEPSGPIAHGRPTGTGEQVEQKRALT
jgi:hypothetical protein